MKAGELLRSVRLRHGLSQARLARRAGTSQAAISKIERDLVSPSFETLDGIFAAMGERLELAAARRPATLDHDPEARRHVRSQSPAARLQDALEFAEFADRLASGARRRT